MTILLVILAVILSKFCNMDFRDTCLALTLFMSIYKEYQEYTKDDPTKNR